MSTRIIDLGVPQGRVGLASREAVAPLIREDKRSFIRQA
jgi:hypothetical protein